MLRNLFNNSSNKGYEPRSKQLQHGIVITQVAEDTLLFARHFQSIGCAYMSKIQKLNGAIAWTNISSDKYHNNSHNITETGIQELLQGIQAIIMSSTATLTITEIYDKFQDTVLTYTDSGMYSSN